MTTRAEMVEKAAGVIASGDGVPFARLEHLEVADAVLDAVLPQVSTVAELASLPLGTKLLAANGSVWWRVYDFEWWRTESDSYDHQSANLLGNRGPLTVVWSPS